MIKKYLFLMLFFYYQAFCGAIAELSKNEITVGEAVELIIKADGKDIKFPDIQEIAGYKIESTQSSQNIQISNGNITQSSIKSYLFTPTEIKDIEVPSFEVIVDKKIHKTEPLKLTVKAQTKEPNQPFELKMEINKNSGYVGEQFDIKLLFRRKASEKVLDLDYQQPNFEHLWVKQVGKEQTYQDDEYIVHEINYIAFPQKSGQIKIPPARMRITTTRDKKDFFGFIVQEPISKAIFSNDLNIEAKELPSGIKLVGDFKIEAVIDKNQSEPNKPINLTLTIIGKGNVDDIDEIELNLANATVYSDKAQRKYDIKNGIYQGIYKKSFSIISDSSYSIDPIEIKFFDPKSKTIKSTKTEKIDITILGSQKISQAPKLLTAQNESNDKMLAKTNSYHLIAIFISGLISGILLMLIAKKNLLRLPIFKKNGILLPNDQKEMLLKLLPFYGQDKELNRILCLLEENIYQSKNNKIGKKELLSILKKLQIKEFK